MEKIEQLIQMMEHPEQYSNDQWREILKDKDCREYYQLISETDNAIHDKPLSDKDVNRAQKNFESKYYSSTPHFLLLRKIAAIFIGLILISCIAIAAVSIVKHHQRTQTSLTHNGIINHKIKDSVKTVVMKTGSVKRKSSYCWRKTICQRVSGEYSSANSCLLSCKSFFHRRKSHKDKTFLQLESE
jgi:hypothetical protein